MTKEVSITTNSLSWSTMSSSLVFPERLHLCHQEFWLIHSFNLNAERLCLADKKKEAGYSIKPHLTQVLQGTAVRGTLIRKNTNSKIEILNSKLWLYLRQTCRIKLYSEILKKKEN